MNVLKSYFGVVEDSTGDPLKLGRCKVRVLGVHTDDKLTLPTSDLPWATPLQNVTSAAVSGIGAAPVGLVNGSTVMVSFLDGDACQMPIIMGAIAGIPQGSVEVQVTGDAAPKATYTTGDSNAPVGSDGSQLQSTEQGGGFVTIPTEPTATGEIGSLSSDDYLKYREVIAKRESGGKYSAINSLNYLGRYQFGAAALTDFGYVKKGYNNKDLKTSSAWTGKDGIKSHTDFLNSQAVQDNCMKLFTKQNYTILRKKGVVRNDSPANHTAGLLAVSHLKGPGDAIKFGQGRSVSPDAYGTSAESYYKLGYAAISGAMPNVMPTPDSVVSNTETTISTGTGFGDPDGVFPRKKYLREPDTNRLARGQGISSTVVGYKEASRTTRVRVALSDMVWDQPHIPYATVYPHNRVFETPNGLIQEFDDSPNSVRYHLFHPAGTFTEIDNNGTVVNRIIGDRYEILDRNGYITIKGDCNITVQGNTNILVQENANIEVYGDCKAEIKNDLDIKVSGTMNTYVQEDYNIKCKSFNVETFNGDINMVSAKNLKTTSVNDTLIEASDNTGIKAKKVLTTESGTDSYYKSGAKSVTESKGHISFKTTDIISGDGIGTYFQAGKSIPSKNVHDTIKDSANGNTGGTTISDPIKSGLIRQQLINNDLDNLPNINTYWAVNDGVYESPDDGALSDNFKSVLKDTYTSVGELGMAASVGTAFGTSMASHKTPKIISGQSVDCTIFYNEQIIPMGLQLSDNYSLKQFCSSQLAPKQIVAQHGLTPGQLVCNLKNLAINVVEEIRKLYPDIRITSALRYAGAGHVLDNTKTNVSQHEYGMATDLQFGPAYKVSDYYDIAVKLSQSISFDQLILEYGNNCTTCWIHISYNSNGNRNELYTYSNQVKYSSGLHKLS